MTSSSKLNKKLVTTSRKHNKKSVPLRAKLHPQSQHPVNISGHKSCEMGDIIFSLGGHRHYGSGDMMVLVYHLILQDHVIKGSCDFMGKSLSRYVTILPSLVAIGTEVMKI